MKKPTNHLASQVERLAGFKFPHQQQINQLNHLTERVKQAWQAILPDTMLTTLMVIADDGLSLTISTDNHTLANHLNYSRQPLLAQLQQVEPTLSRLTGLKFRVIPPIAPLNTKQNIQSNQNVTNVKSCELSDLTKQNIAQVIELVTDDLPLQRALQKLLKT